jgi:thymidylate synthase
MNKIDAQYQALLQDILDNGVRKGDRTGTGTISVFGRQIRHKMSDGFPLLTTKKMFFKGIATELIWFLRGDTNIKYLVDNGCHIWDGDAYKNFIKWRIETDDKIRRENPTIDFAPLEYESKEEFIELIKTDPEFAKEFGELGPIYGKQWRAWAQYSVREVTFSTGSYTAFRHEIDQIANLIKDLKTNPDSRRLMVSAWNVGEINSMVLPPCHYGFQVYTRELTMDERLVNSKLSNKTDLLKDRDLCEEAEKELSTILDLYNTPKRAISLMWNQRSVDTFLGLPFNIASYALLLEIIAKEVNMIPDELIGNLGDVHLYSNHIEQAKEQIGRELTQKERLELLQDYNKAAVDEIRFSILTPEETDSLLDTNKVPKRTREPMKLPTLKLSDWYSTQGDTSPHATIVDISTIYPSHIRLENYQSHPSIKADLSN